MYSRRTMSSIGDHIEALKKGECKNCGHWKFHHDIKGKTCMPVIRGVSTEQLRPNWGSDIGGGLTCGMDVIKCNCKGFEKK